VAIGNRLEIVEVWKSGSDTDIELVPSGDGIAPRPDGEIGV
jgi:hypothetical protein